MLGVVVVAAVAVLVGSNLGGDVAPSPTLGATKPVATNSSTPSLAPSSTTAVSPALTEVRCDATEKFTLHIHALLSIRVDGQLVRPPANVGITSQCFYWLHTHNDSGLIHVEAPTQADFTLGQFFDVWAEPLSTIQVADFAVGPGQLLYVFVDGQRQEAMDPRTIVLRDRESIELQIGSAPLDPLPAGLS